VSVVVILVVLFLVVHHGGLEGFTDVVKLLSRVGLQRFGALLFILLAL